MSRQSLGLLIFTHRQRLGIMQTQMAERLGMTQGCFSKIETGQLAVGLCEARELARVLGLDLYTLADELARDVKKLPEHRIPAETKAERAQRLGEYFGLVPAIEKAS
jgi:ribosome-binding protein aMBF1 (putative translation factor)